VALFVVINTSAVNYLVVSDELFPDSPSKKVKNLVDPVITG